MNWDQSSVSAWAAVLQGTTKVRFDFLALQLFVGNLKHQLQAGEISLADSLRELSMFRSNFGRLPMAAKDFARVAQREPPLTNRLSDPAEVARRITAGECLMLAGAEALLAALPPGNWIGGTIPYFMLEDGNRLCRDKIFVTGIPPEFSPTIHRYQEAELPGIHAAAGSNEVSFVILPADSAVHTAFALHAPHYAGFALHPLVGWVAGIELGLAHPAAPKVFCGGPAALGDCAVTLRLRLPDDRGAQIKIINPFQPGPGDTIRFAASGLAATTAIINGREENLCAYLRRSGADTRLPLVANYCGAMVNVSLKTLDPENRRVEFYAPVVAGIEYRLARPIEDYGAEFAARRQEVAPDQVLFSCNCILNYLHSGLEGGTKGVLAGPATFGEIAYQLLNQTLVYVEIVPVAPAGTPRGDTEAGAAALQLSAAHDELEMSERRFRALGESLHLGIFLTDMAGNVVYANDSFQKISQAFPDEADGGWTRHIHPTDLPGVVAALADSHRHGHDFDREFRFVRRDGRACWVHSRTTPLRSETGELTGDIGTIEDITARKSAETELERVQQELIDASHKAGAAEFTTGVLHNVKNVVNSINVSATVISRMVKESKSPGLTRLSRLMHEQGGDLGLFLTRDPKGRQVPAYLELLAAHLEAERKAVLEELRHLESDVHHVKEIVTMEQDFAKLGGTSEKMRPGELMADALRINAASLSRHGVQVTSEHDPDLPEITVEKHKVLQILINFIRNAKDACNDSGRPERNIVLRVRPGDSRVLFSVTDNGVGITPEARARIFAHGFSTKKQGHGFGLHSGARAARDLGGALEVHSDGPGTGATFTLILPLGPPAPGPGAADAVGPGHPGNEPSPAPVGSIP